MVNNCSPEYHISDLLGLQTSAASVQPLKYVEHTRTILGRRELPDIDSTEYAEAQLARVVLKQVIVALILKGRAIRETSESKDLPPPASIGFTKIAIQKIYH